MNDTADLFKKLADGIQRKELSSSSKRGRTLTGKRSNPDWIGRTFYIRKETDLDIEAELLELKRQEVELDKSVLVDALLTAWLKWRKGENVDAHLSEITSK